MTLKETKYNKHIQIKTDELFKSIMEDKIAAREFLEEYLPNNLRMILDLNKISVEKESYIEDDLKKKYSDIVYSIELKKQNESDAGDIEKVLIYIYC